LAESFCQANKPLKHAKNGKNRAVLPSDGLRQTLRGQKETVGRSAIGAAYL